MKNRIIIHFQPIEFYPPVQNLINTLSKENKFKNKFYVLTNLAYNTDAVTFNSPSSDIIISRLAKTGQNLSAFSRYANYFFFYLKCLFLILYRRPSIILYFETLSSYPAYLYKKYFGKKATIMIHYHEYTSPEEYSSGMKLARYFHKCEKWLYPKSSWISHTNEFRMQHFVDDNLPIKIEHKHVLPNYPPRYWHAMPKAQPGNPIKIVYVGALSLETMFLNEFANWVVGQKGKVVWDIYSQNITTDAKIFLQTLPSNLIRLNNSVAYNKLPIILKGFDIGVVLYRGHIANYVFNAPNKLFEYHVSGLDVWFPDVMKGSKPYVTEYTYPKILALDFRHLDQVNLKEMINRSGHNKQTCNFFCEDILYPVCVLLLE